MLDTLGTVLATVSSDFNESFFRLVAMNEPPEPLTKGIEILATVKWQRLMGAAINFKSYFSSTSISS